MDHNHLSAGNSVEYGVSKQNSPTDTIEMVKSVAIPSNVSISSDDSNAFDAHLEENLGLAPTSDTQEIFRAAQYFSRKDRDEALAERKKNARLLDYITALGLPLEDVNNLSSIGTLAAIANALKVLYACPVFGRPSSSSTPPSLSHAPPIGSTVVRTFYVGESSLSVRNDPSCQMLPPPLATPGPVSNSGKCLPSFSSSSSLREGEVPGPTSGKSQSWSAIVSKNSTKSSLDLSFFNPSPVSEDGSILVKPPVDALLRGNKLWSSSLVGYFLHSKLPYKVMEPIATKLWGNLGLLKVFLHDNGYYIFKFKSVTDRDNILASGPCHFASKVMVLQPWKAGVEFTKADCTKVPIWIKLCRVPYSYWSAEGISYNASNIDKPLFADEMTAKLNPISYARICIEVDVSFSFPNSINADVYNKDSCEEVVVPITVEYQSRPPSCQSCKVFGHSSLKCPKSNYKLVFKVVSSEQSKVAPPCLAPL